jgi:holliday junction DNA helicase RuvA
MYDFIEGQLVEKSPTSIVIQEGGIGYFIHISLFTYSSLPEAGICRIYIHQVVREDALLLFGFSGREERETFRHLISVSGIGANTARMILSSLAADDLVKAIMEEDVHTLQGIKGIGTKTAQRIIIDLKDKLGKGAKTDGLFLAERNTIREEALSALVALGFVRKQAEKAVGTLLARNPQLSLEEVVKQALKLL